MQVEESQLITSASLDENLKVKFRELPSHIAAWADSVGGLKGKRVLDFGCGYGLTAAGVAIAHGPQVVHGVDINSEHTNCLNLLHPTGIQHLPENLNFCEISPGQKISDGVYDFVYAWSVFEHVSIEIIDSVIKDIRSSIVDGGHMFVQIAPLYFSSEGAHLWELGFTSWEHLKLQGNSLRALVSGAPHLSEQRKGELLGMFDSLNRITASDLIRRFERNGFELVREQRDKIDGYIEPALCEAYNEDALRTFQIVALFRKLD